MGVEFKQNGSSLRILLIGEIDHHTARKICEEIDIKLTILKPETVFLDFGAVSFMDSSGLAVVAGRRRLCDRLKIKIYITNISGYPKKILRLAGADKLIEFWEDGNEI